VKGYASAYSWSFTSSNFTEIDRVSALVGVYPTVTKGEITVKTLSSATIRVMSITGSILDKQESTGGEWKVNLNYADGIYLVIVETEQSVSTHRVILKR
jgi:hypothetical protein